MTVYEIGHNGYWTGRTKSIPDDQGAPLSWTRIEVPALADGEYAFWTGIWSVVNATPASAYVYATVTPTTGPQGIQGIQGLTGVAGIDGIIGVDGQQGIQGVAGIDGIIGVDGQQGIQGVAGIDGIIGVDGQQGIQGIQGIQGPAGTSTTSDGSQVTQPPYRQYDELSVPLTYYKGWSTTVSTSTSTWKILKGVEVSTGNYVETWADGNDLLDNIWDNRLTKNYR